MKVVTKGKHKIKFYDSIRKLPIRRYSKFNKHMIIANEVGESIGDYDKRMQRAIGYIASEDMKSAMVELTNQRQGLHNALQEYSPVGMALAIMVHSIDGKEFDDFEEDTLSLILDQLDSIGFNKEDLDNTVMEVKKN